MTASSIASESFGIVSCRATGSVLELREGARLGEGRREPAYLDLHELVGDRRVDLVDRGRRDAVGLEPCPQQPERVALAPAVELARRPVLAGVAAGVADVAVRDRL